MSGSETMRWARMVGKARLLVGVVLAPAVVPVMVAVCLEPLLSWFRPHGSNVAIGMFAVMTIGAAAVVAYVLGLAVSYSYVCRKRDEGRLNVWIVTKGALKLALGYSVLAVAIRLISGSFVLAGTMVVMMIMAYTLAAACFYLIACAGNTRAGIDHPQALRV